MKAIATIKISIPFNQTLLETMEQYSKAAQIVADVGHGQEICNKRLLHDATYSIVRDMLNLPAQLVCSSRDKACEVLKSVFRKHGSKPVFKPFLPVRYDARSFSFNWKETSLCSVKGRIKIPIQIAEYYKRYLGWNVDAANLIYDSKKRLFLHVIVSKDVENNTDGNNAVVGVDVGINPLAVTSNKQFFHNTMIPTMKRYERLRTSLQAKGTKSARRHLRKLSGREKRFKANMNHIISKQTVQGLNAGDVIVLEDIKYIRRGKKGKQWKWLHKWNYRQLATFIEYKGLHHGNSTVHCNPVNTSKRCSRCGSMHTERNRGWFHCLDCCYSLNSHLNASFNIRLLGMSVAARG